MTEVFKGLNDSLTLLAFRLQSIKPVYRILMFFMVAGILFTIYLSTFTAEFMLTILTTPVVDSPATESVNTVKQYISTYIDLYASGNLDIFVAVSVALLLGSILFVPFSGYIIHGVVSNSELTTVKNGDYYRVGDSILFQFISSFTFIQLVGLTVISELLTIDTPNPGLVTVFVWFAWIALTLLTSFIAWVVEYVSRKFGKPVKFSILGALIILFTAAVALDPNHATTLFGAANPIFTFLQTMAGADGLNLFLTAIAVTTAIIILTIIAVGKTAAKALELPELPSISQDKKNKQRKAIAHPTKYGFMPLTLNILFRYPTVIRPIATSTAFSVIIATVITGTSAITTTLIVLPLAVGISFGANMFGLYGNANNYLLSLPKFRETIVRKFTAIITITILSVYTIVYGLSFLLGRVTAENLLTALPSMLGVTAVVVVISVWLSVKNPLPFSAKTRENVVSSPIVLIAYVTLYIASTSLIGNLPGLVDNTTTAWQITAVIILVSAALLTLIDRRWRHTEKWSMRVLDKTVNAG